MNLRTGVIDVRIGGPDGVADPSREIPALIALLNDALDDADPRKITWEMVDALREWADNEDESEAVRYPSSCGINTALARSIADILAGYLPPREEV